MEVYLPDNNNKRLRHRIVFDDLIFIESLDNNSLIYMTGGRTLLMETPIEKLFDWYFKKITHSLMRSHADFIVNPKHIISAEESKITSDLTLHLTGEYKALLRRGHDYAYFILNGAYKKKDTPEHSDVKDAIIMSETKDIHAIIAKIKQDTGESVSHRYITARYKTLKQMEYVNKS